MAYEPDDSFDPDALDKSLQMEQSLHPEETDVELADRLLREAGPRAALSVIDLATSSSAPSVRLAASKVILDRVLPDGAAGKEDPLTAMVRAMQQDAVAYANKNS